MKAGADTVAPLSSVTCLSTPDTVDPFATSSAVSTVSTTRLGGADAQHLALVHHELVDIAFDQELAAVPSTSAGALTWSSFPGS